MRVHVNIQQTRPLIKTRRVYTPTSQVSISTKSSCAKFSPGKGWLSVEILQVCNVMQHNSNETITLSVQSWTQLSLLKQTISNGSLA